MNKQAAILTAKIVAGIAGVLFLIVLALTQHPEWTLAAIVMGCLAFAIYSLYKVVCLELESRERAAQREAHRGARQRELERKTRAYLDQINRETL